MKHILYATDYTDHSLVGLQYAYDLSTRLRAKLTVVHIFDIPTFSGITMIRPLQQTQKRASAEQRVILEAYCAKHLGKISDNENVKTEVLKHISVADGILKMIKKLAIDMTIIGIKDKYSKRGFLEGDIARTLITKISCPLMVIPKNSNVTKIKNIVYATDFEEDDIFAIKRLTEIAVFFEATIHVVHISSEEKDEDKNQMVWFKEMLFQKVSYPHIEFDILVSDNIYYKLNEFLKSLDADIIALLERDEQSLLKRIFHKDIVKQMESHTTIPLLSFTSV